MKGKGGGFKGGGFKGGGFKGGGFKPAGGGGGWHSPGRPWGRSRWRSTGGGGGLSCIGCIFGMILLGLIGGFVLAVLIMAGVLGA